MNAKFSQRSQRIATANCLLIIADKFENTKLIILDDIFTMHA